MNPLAVRFLAVCAAVGAFFAGTSQAAQIPQPETVGPGDDGTGSSGALDDLVPLDNMPPAGYSNARNDTIFAVRAAGAGWTEVLCVDGRVERRTGVRSWRNNNPGNIEFGSFAQSKGAVGTDGRFAVFPTYEAGRQAKAALIFEGGNYKGLTLTAAIARYAPASENNTSWYASTVLAAVSGQNKRMSDFDPAERLRILDAMERVEGFKVGSVQQLAGATYANTVKLLAFGAIAAAGLIIVGKLSKALPAIGNAFNPLSDQNLAYQGVNGVVSAAVGYDETLGGWFHDTFSSKGDAVKEMLNPPKRTSDADAYFSTSWNNPMGDFQ